METIQVDICYYYDENGNKVYDTDLMIEEFEYKLKNLQ
jgi:hypothetical protein